MPFIVRDINAAQILTTTGTWIPSSGSRKVAVFETAEAAQAAIPAGSSAQVQSFVPRPWIESTCLLMKPPHFFLKSGSFGMPTAHADIQDFASEQAALAKTVELGLDIDAVTVAPMVGTPFAFPPHPSRA